jgi:hypothetical protein
MRDIHLSLFCDLPVFSSCSKTLPIPRRKESGAYLNLRGVLPFLYYISRWYPLVFFFLTKWTNLNLLHTTYEQSEQQNLQKARMFSSIYSLHTHVVRSIRAMIDPAAAACTLWESCMEGNVNIPHPNICDYALFLSCTHHMYSPHTQ